MSTNTRDPREIEADLEHNRARMSNTLDNLEHKFSPGELFEQAWNYARERGNGEMAANLRDTIARNPLPITLVGLGLAWLLISGRRGSAVSEYSSETDTRSYEGGPMPADFLAPTGGAEFGDPGLSDDDAAADLDEPSFVTDTPGPAVYGDARSSTSAASDNVAEGREAGNAVGKRGIHVTLGRASGPEDKSLHGRI